MTFPKKFLVDVKTSTKTFTCPRCMWPFSANGRWRQKSEPYVLCCKNPNCDMRCFDTQSSRKQDHVGVQRSIKKKMAIDSLLNPIAKQGPVENKEDEHSNKILSAGSPTEYVAPSSTHPSSTDSAIALRKLNPQNESPVSQQDMEINDQTGDEDAEALGNPAAIVRPVTPDSQIKPIAMNTIHNASSIPAESSGIIGDMLILGEEGPGVVEEEAGEELVNLFDYYDQNPVTGPACGVTRRLYPPVVLQKNNPAVPNNENIPNTGHQDMDLQKLMCSEDELDLEPESGSDLDSDWGADPGLDSGSGSGLGLGLGLGLGSGLGSGSNSDEDSKIGSNSGLGVGPDPGSISGSTSQVGSESTVTAPVHDLHSLLEDIMSMDASLDILDRFDPEGFVSTTGIVPTKPVHDPMEGNTDVKSQDTTEDYLAFTDFPSDYWGHGL